MKFEKILPHLGIVLLLLMSAVFYFKPVVFDGKSLSEHDNVQARGMQTELYQYIKKEGRIPNWTNQVFVGMPSYQIMGNYPNNLVQRFCHYVIRFGAPINTPHTVMFMMMLFTFLALLVLGVDKWVAAIGGLAFGFMTNNLILFEAGHSTKLHALVYIAPMLAGAITAFRGKYLLGGVILAFCLSGQISANHLQVTYYTFLMLGGVGLTYLIHNIVKKTMPNFLKATMVLGIAVFLGVMSNLALLWTTYEYSQETIRGKSELAAKKDKVGLDKDYIFGWSYGKMETFTLIVPHFYGGANSKYFADDQSKPGMQLGNSNSAKVVKKLLGNVQNPQQSQQIGQQLIGATSQYWGAQPFTSGPVYFGAIICMLFFLGVYMVKGPIKWALVGSMIFLVLLSWGDNFKVFNYFMVDHFPMYNKFRAVSMALTASQALAVLMAILGLSRFLQYEGLGKELKEGESKGLFMDKIFAAAKLEASRVNYLYFAAGTAALFCVLAIIYSFVGNLSAASDAQLLKQAPQFSELVDAIQADRAALIRSDAFKSLIFILLGTAALWAYATEKIKSSLVAVGIVGLLIVTDLVWVDRMYVNDESFERKSEIVSAPPATQADEKVKADQDPHFRVFDLIAGMRTSGRQSSPFSNAEGAFFHKVIGGYHAAKPILLQELVEKHIVDNSILTDKIHILGMLNVKWILQSPEIAVQNPEVMGNAWFVENIKYVDNADLELDGLTGLSPRSEIITQKKNEAYFAGMSNAAAAGDYIALTSYHPERLVYKSKTTNERLAVFSEIYYPPTKGWNVYIDGKLVKEGFVKVNYLLRAMRVPAGEHTVEMRFEPRSYFIGETSALISSLLILAFVGFVAWTYYKKDNSSAITKEETAKATNIEEASVKKTKPKKNT